jgi:hypothetical protein
MSTESDRDELKALKGGFETLARETRPRREIEIPFTDKGTRRVGDLISRAAIDERKKTEKP